MTERTVAGGAAPRFGGRPLRELRAERLMTVRELARAAGLAPATIYRIEAGHSMPHSASIRKIATVLGVTPDAVAELRGVPVQAGEPANDRQAVQRLTAKGYPRILALRALRRIM